MWWQKRSLQELLWKLCEAQVSLVGWLTLDIIIAIAARCWKPSFFVVSSLRSCANVGFRPEWTSAFAFRRRSNRLVLWLIRVNALRFVWSCIRCWVVMANKVFWPNELVDLIFVVLEYLEVF